MKTLRRIRYSITRGLRNLVQHGHTALHSVWIIAAALSVLGLVALLYLNVQRVTTAELGSSRVSVFMTLAASPAESEALRQRIAEHPFVASSRVVPPGEGLAELADHLNQPPAIFGAEAEKSVPQVIDFTVRHRFRTQVRALVTQIEADPQVEAVVYLERLLDQAVALSTVIRWIGGAFVVLVGLAFSLVVSNATLLSMQARLEEIRILLLIGAPHGFVRRIFIVEGLGIAGLGTALALGLVALGFQALKLTLTESELAPNIAAQMQFFPPFALLIIAGVLLGLAALGSLLAIQRMLRQVG